MTTSGITTLPLAAQDVRVNYSAELSGLAVRPYVCAIFKLALASKLKPSIEPIQRTEATIIRMIRFRLISSRAAAFSIIYLHQK